jgi:hypothetical protein
VQGIAQLRGKTYPKQPHRLGGEARYETRATLRNIASAQSRNLRWTHHPTRVVRDPVSPCRPVVAPGLLLVQGLKFLFACLPNWHPCRKFRRSETSHRRASLNHQAVLLNGTCSPDVDIRERSRAPPRGKIHIAQFIKQHAVANA